MAVNRKARTPTTRPDNANHAKDHGAGSLPQDRHLDRLTADAEADALSANTIKTYRTGWKSWARWAAEHGLAVFPATPEALNRWLAALHKQGRKKTTLDTYAAAVSYARRNRPSPNPARHPKARRLLAKLARRAAAQGRGPKQADPLRRTHIQQMIAVAHLPRRNQPGGRLETPGQARKRAETDIAMIIIAYDALLRCGELLNLIWADIEPPDDTGCGTVRIRRSKTDQTGQGAIVPIPEFAYQAFMRIKPHDANPEDRIFDMSPSTVTRRIKAAARAAGIDPANISSHSLRIGMAQDLAASGIGLPGLMLAGRWKAAAMVARYTQNLTARHTPAAQYLKTQNFTCPMAELPVEISS